MEEVSVISICTTVYHETDALETFIRSIYRNSSDKNVFEIIVVNDENYLPTTKRLKDLQKIYPRVKLIPFTKADRIKHIKKMIKFYKKIRIFEAKHIVEMEKTLAKYESGKLKELWIPTPLKFNLAAKKAKGDMLLFVPGDYYVFFDIADLYNKSQIMFRERGQFYGHPDWVDLKNIDPDYILSSLRGEKNVKELSDEIFVKAVTVPVPAQHGVRVVSKELFDRIGGFDDRWFTRAIGEDWFNEKCRGSWGSPYGFLNYPLFENDPMYVGALRHDNKKLNYLTPSYSLMPEHHWEFVTRIKDWLKENEN